MSFPDITFGMIVLNGEPFIRYNLRALYPHARQIIAVEGATPHAKAVAAADGHSADGTLETLRDFKAREDPEDKLVIVTAEDEGHPDGFWPGEKEEMSRAYARRATGDWLWQVDVDEFYLDEDVKTIGDLIARRPGTTAISFREIPFWGSLDYRVDGPFFRGQMVGGEFHRLFRWARGYVYRTHRPPTVVDDKGRDLRSLGWIDSQQTSSMGVYLYHYALLFPDQVRRKCAYYQDNRDPNADDPTRWAQRGWDAIQMPFHVHNANRQVAWLESYREKHPGQIEQMWNDIRERKINLAVRPMNDVRRLLRSPVFRLVRMLARRWPEPDAMRRRGTTRYVKLVERLIQWYEKGWQRRYGTISSEG